LYDIGNPNFSNRRRIGSHDPMPATSLYQEQSSKKEGPQHPHRSISLS